MVLLSFLIYERKAPARNKSEGVGSVSGGTISSSVHSSDAASDVDNMRKSEVVKNLRPFSSVLHTYIYMYSFAFLYTFILYIAILFLHLYLYISNVVATAAATTGAARFPIFTYRPICRTVYTIYF